MTLPLLHTDNINNYIFIMTSQIKSKIVLETRKLSGFVAQHLSGS